MRWQHNLSKLTSQVEGGLGSVSRVMAMVAAYALSLMMLLTVADVIGRYFFNRPIKGTYELVGLTLVCAATWGLAYCQIQRGHIRVMLLVEHFPPRVQTVLNSLAYLLGLGGLSVICWRTLLLTKTYISLAGAGVTVNLHVPFWPFMLMLAIGAGMFSVIFLIDLLHSLAKVIRK